MDVLACFNQQRTSNGTRQNKRRVWCLSGRVLAVAIRSEGAPAAVILGLTRGNQQNAVALADGDPGLHPFTAGCRNVAFPLNGVLRRVFLITPQIDIRLE